MDRPLDGTVTIVTGASSGIGAAIARRFAQEGGRLVLAARRREALEQLRDELDRIGPTPLVVPADVSKYSDVQSLIDQTLDAFGSIDVMVNNAGNAIAKPVVDSTPEEIDTQIDVNLKGLCYGCRAVAPVMIRQGKGDIINIGSICSFRHFPDYATYVAAKFGMLGFSRSLYEEVRPFGVRVNVLCPAAVNTEWADLAGTALPWPKSERLQPEDLAELAFLCVRLPRRVQLESVVLWPTCEPTA